jgi:hypothetical protein
MLRKVNWWTKQTWSLTGEVRRQLQVPDAFLHVPKESVPEEFVNRAV